MQIVHLSPHEFCYDRDWSGNPSIWKFYLWYAPEVCVLVRDEQWLHNVGPKPLFRLEVPDEEAVYLRLLGCGIDP
jgi:hypothetical protein